MLTVVCDTPGTLRAEQRSKPVRAEGEVLVRVKRVGVCGTDMHIFTGKQPYLNYPRVMGHELSGLVEEAPPGSALAPGDPVYIMPYLSCGRCSACAKGKTNCCRNIQVLGVHRDGAFTEYLSLPEHFVHKAEGITLDQAAMVEFLAIGAHAVRRGDVLPGQQVLVVGTGPIGMAISLFARLRGGIVTVLDSRADRLQFCRDHLGVAAAIEVGSADLEALSGQTGGDFFDLVFDATGNPAAMERGFQFVGHGGTYVLVSIVSSAITFSDPEFHKREMTLMGSRNATEEDFRLVVQAMRDGLVPDRALNTHRLALDRVPADFPDLLLPTAGVVKAIVEC